MLCSNGKHIFEGKRTWAFFLANGFYFYTLSQKIVRAARQLMLNPTEEMLLKNECFLKHREKNLILKT